MDSFSSPSSGSSATQFNPDAFKDQLKNQLAQAYAEEFLEVNLSISFSLSIMGFLYSSPCWVYFVYVNMQSWS